MKRVFGIIVFLIAVPFFAQAAVSSSPKVVFQENFSSYSASKCLVDGDSLGKWKVIFAGYGCVKVESIKNNKLLTQKPKPSSTAGETHAALVVGPSFSGATTYELTMNTIKQLRSGSAANPWETAWFMWNYSDNAHSYYVTFKPNGWELGKLDPSYVGGQRFLATGSAPVYSLNSSIKLKVIQTATGLMTIYANGKKITSFQDQESPYLSGSIGLYNEDAYVSFDDIKVTQ